MESFAHLSEPDRWDLTHFVRSRFIKDPKKAEFETDVFSKRVEVELNEEIGQPDMGRN